MTSCGSHSVKTCGQKRASLSLSELQTLQLSCSKGLGGPGQDSPPTVGGGNQGRRKKEGDKKLH